MISGAIALPFKWNAWKDLFTLKPESAKKLISTKIGAGFFIFASSVVGAIVGWNKGKQGQEQHQESQAQFANADAEVTHLKQIVTVQEENQKRFTDVIASRKPEGSHVAAAEAHKQATASTAPTI
jgi:hypothetical protein